MIGDGAMTGGVAFEAIGQAGGLGTPMVVVLNDNGMSIAPNVGALSRYFNRVRLNPKLWHARSGVEGGLTRLPGGIGSAFERLGPQLKESIKAFWAPGLWWEELDWAYMGVIDGHDVRALREALREALAAERPVVVHIATVKGKGFAPAEDGGLEGMEEWHAAKPKSIVNGLPATRGAAHGPPDGQGGKAPAPQYTKVFGEALVRECERDERVVGITAAMNSGTGLSILQKAMPERYFDVGIAEQQAILFASGLALEGVKPVAAIYSTFLQRAYDQIVHDVCLQKLNVVFAMDRAGLVGDDGPTHHGAFDIAYLRCLPNIVLMAPRDEAMLVHMLRTALLVRRPDRAALPARRGHGRAAARTSRSAIAIGTGEILREGGAGETAGQARRADRLRQRRRQGAGGGRGAGGARHLGDGRRCALCKADRRRADGAAGGRARSAGDGRGGRARGRLRLGRLGDAHQRPAPTAAHPARRAARPLRDARQARAAARGGRLHAAAHRRARARGDLRSRVGDRRGLSAACRPARTRRHRAEPCRPLRRQPLPRRRWARARVKKRPAGEAGRFEGGGMMQCCGYAHDDAPMPGDLCDLDHSRGPSADRRAGRGGVAVTGVAVSRCARVRRAWESDVSIRCSPSVACSPRAAARPPR